MQRTGGRRWLAGIAGLTVFLAVVTAALLSGCTPSGPKPAADTPEPPPKLVVLTPHNARIRESFEAGFVDWYNHNHEDPAPTIQWVTMGTVECVDYVDDIVSIRSDVGSRPTPDVFFGGGITAHRTLIERRQAHPVELQDAVADIPDTILGLPTRDPEGHWHATALSSFGVLYHQRGCEQRGLPAPNTWADLAEPDYYGWVAMADPNRSGSNRQCLVLILQKLGWEKGWEIILRMAANCRALRTSSHDVIEDVREGVALAGLSVSFTAMHEIANAPEGELAYIDPPHATAITPDVISVLACATKPRLSEEFVRFCLSEKGQALWGVEAEHLPPFASTLYRYPVDPAVYETHAGKLSVNENPLKMTTDFQLNLDAGEKHAAIIAPLVRAACGENHIRLQTCWKKIIDAGMPSEALAELTAVPFSQDEAMQMGADLTNGGAQPDELVKTWSQLFRDRYERIAASLN